MPRYKLTIEYDGTDFCGWQRQPDRSSIQGALEEAAFKLSGERTEPIAAGRTDAGVHARGQVVHLDLSREFPEHEVSGGLNFHLRPLPIAVLSAEQTDAAFHARFSATRRHYLYRIVNRRSPLALDAERAWHVEYALDAEAMHRAAQLLLGNHDFTSFRASACQSASPVKTLDQLDVTRDGEEVRFRVSARSFLHHQVRNMVGTLALVGGGRWTEEDIRHALSAKDRAKAGQTAPACGLYLMQVDYE